MIVILMGVAGSGKTTIGSRLADSLGWTYYEGDDFHPPENVAKMSSGIALTDSDRAPWLQALANLISNLTTNNSSAVIACSALKSAYRERLKTGAGPNTDQVLFVYLKIPPSVAHERLRKREGHFMPEALISSQFEALEEPADAIVVNATSSPDKIAAQIKQALGL
ncbi:MAG: gluconokinase [Blastocatellia bacterium]